MASKFVTPPWVKSTAGTSKKDGLEDDVPFQMGLFLASMLIFQGVIWTCGHGFSMMPDGTDVFC